LIDILIFIMTIGSLFGFVLFVWCLIVSAREFIKERRKRRILRDKSDP